MNLLKNQKKRIIEIGLHRWISKTSEEIDYLQDDTLDHVLVNPAINKKVITSDISNVIRKYSKGSESSRCTF